MVVEPHVARFEEPLELESGRTLPEFELAYEVYGQLGRSPVIWLCHGLSGTAHAAGRYADDPERIGWWEQAIGPGRMLDTDRFCVICSNILGGSGGSSGPATPNPATGRPYALDFPVVTIPDMVRAQVRLMERLEIPQLHSVVGGCLGGSQALTWGQLFPDKVGSVIAIGATAATSAHSLAFFEVIRQAIRRDPLWAGGDYYAQGQPSAGLTLSGLIGMLFWMTPEAMEERFGRRRKPSSPQYSLEPEFETQHFLQRIADGVERKFDPNALLYTTRAMDYFDLQGEQPSLANALQGYRARTLLVSYQSDWRYPPPKVQQLADALELVGVEVAHQTLDSIFGHGAYLYDLQGLAPVVRQFLSPRRDD